MIINVIVVMLLVAANGFFVAAEFALVKVREGEHKASAGAGNSKAARVQLILRHLDTYLSSCQLGITLASLGLGWVGEPMVARSLEPILRILNIPVEWNHFIAFPAAFTAITFLHITIGEQVPKIYAITKFNQVSLHVAHPLFWFTTVFKPFIWTLNTLSNKMLGLIGFDTDNMHGGTITEAELRLLLRESREGGHVTRKEHKMIVNILDLEDKFARRYAVPRQNITFLKIDNTMEENLRLAAHSKHTRLPLCEDVLEHCVGFVHIKDIFQSLAVGNSVPDLKSLSRPVSILPETTKLESLLAYFQKEKTHLVLLVDEFGSVSGMITLENVLEEVVGAIQDEFDQEDAAITIISEKEADVHGTCPIDHLCRALHIQPRNTSADTAGGYVTELANSIPQKGASYTDGELTCSVIDATPYSVLKIKITKIEG